MVAENHIWSTKTKNQTNQTKTINSGESKMAMKSET